MTHTPGPWHAYDAGYQTTNDDERPMFTIGPEEFHTVALVRPGNTDDDLPAQTPDNASLIASSPDMRAVLERIVALVEKGTAGTGDSLGMIARDAARIIGKTEE